MTLQKYLPRDLSNLVREYVSNPRKDYNKVILELELNLIKIDVTINSSFLCMCIPIVLYRCIKKMEIIPVGFDTCGVNPQMKVGLSMDDELIYIMSCDKHPDDGIYISASFHNVNNGIEHIFKLIWNHDYISSFARFNGCRNFDYNLNITD